MSTLGIKELQDRLEHLFHLKGYMQGLQVPFDCLDISIDLLELCVIVVSKHQLHMCSHLVIIILSVKVTSLTCIMYQFSYVGYADWLISSHFSVPVLKSYPQTVDPERDRSSPDSGEPSSIRNNYSLWKPGEREIG